jgi:hypothetical protein
MKTFRFPSTAYTQWKKEENSVILTLKFRANEKRTGSIAVYNTHPGSIGSAAGSFVG